MQGKCMADPRFWSVGRCGTSPEHGHPRPTPLRNKVSLRGFRQKVGSACMACRDASLYGPFGTPFPERPIVFWIPANSPSLDIYVFVRV